MSDYRLTLAAEMDLADILEYGEAHFGTSAALEFYEGLLSVFPKIVNNPAQFSRIDEVRKGYRRAIYQTYSSLVRLSRTKLIFRQHSLMQDTDYFNSVVIDDEKYDMLLVANTEVTFLDIVALFCTKRHFRN